MLISRKKTCKNIRCADSLSDGDVSSKLDLLHGRHAVQLLPKLVVASGFSDDVAVDSPHQSQTLLQFSVQDAVVLCSVNCVVCVN